MTISSVAKLIRQATLHGLMFSVQTQSLENWLLLADDRLANVFISSFL